jgi:hypothetical protein
VDRVGGAMDPQQQHNTEAISRAMIAAARQAGDLLMVYYKRDKEALSVEFKGTVDLVSEVAASWVGRIEAHTDGVCSG